jgi:hypothetical protein
VVSAALLAFCGYVLEVLVGIYEQTWHTRFGVAELGDEED